MERRGRGWWALAGFGVLTLLGLYVGAYFALVKQLPVRSRNPVPSSAPYIFYAVLPEYPSEWMYSVFEPVHQIDRWQRPKVWLAPKRRFIPEDTN